MLTLENEFCYVLVYAEESGMSYRLKHGFLHFVSITGSGTRCRCLEIHGRRQSDRIFRCSYTVGNFYQEGFLIGCMISITLPAAPLGIPQYRINI